MAGDPSALFASFFAEKLDLVLHAVALAALLLGTVAAALTWTRPRYTRLPWSWFALFAFFYGMASWGQALRVSTGYIALSDALSTAGLAVAFGCLFEFARRSAALVGHPAPVGWWGVPSAVIVASFALYGRQGLCLAVHYALMLPAGLWTAHVLWRAGRLARPGDRHAREVAILVVAMTLSVAVVTPRFVAPPASPVDAERFALFMGVPIHVLRALLLAAVALALGRGAEAARRVARQRVGQSHQRYPTLSLTLLLFVVAGAGALVTHRVGQDARQVLGCAAPTTAVVARSDAQCASAVAARRLPTIGFTMLSCLLIMGFSVVVSRQRDEIEETRASEQHFRGVVQGAPNAVVLCDADGEILSVNPRAVELTGRAEADLAGLSFVDMWPGKDRRAAAEAVRAALSGGTARFSRALERVDGRVVECDVAVTPIRASDGAIHRFAAVIADVTARKRAEEKVRFLARALQSIPEAVTLTDLDNRLIYVNHAFETMYGITEEEALGQTIDIVRLRGGETGPADPVLSSTIGGGWEGTLRNRRRSGDEFPVFLSAAPVLDEHGEPVALIGVATDITDRVRQEENLREAKEAAEAARERLEAANRQLEAAVATAEEMAQRADQANRAKSEFLANMSHEIRTPMNGVIGMTGLLLDTDLTAEQREYSEIIRTSADSLLGLINDILDFSKIEAGRLDLETIDFDLGTLVEETVDMLAVRAHEKGLEFTCSIRDDVPLYLRGDPGRLRQVLLNLCGNAVKFTERGEVGLVVACERQESDEASVRFTVSDTGIGIPAESMDRLFKSFSQVDSSTTRRFGGTGLGLAIAQRLVQQMRGQITVESAVGQGSTFSFTVTLQRQAQPPERPTFRVERLRGSRVLIVDDNRTNRLLLREELRAWGCRPEEVAGGHEALGRLRQAHANGDPFTVAVLDMHMPGMDGEALGQMIKADAALRDTRLVMLSSWGRRGEARRLYEIGFSAFLTKPAKRADLYGALLAVSAPAEDRAVAPPPLVTRHWLAEQRTRRVRVLVAEDNPTNQRVAMRILEQLGYRADTVGNGLEVLKAIEMAPYDIILMDVQMPELDGFETTRRIRVIESGRGGHLPVVAVTAHAMAGDREKCAAAGMDAYVAKPLRPRDLAEVIGRLVPDALAPRLLADDRESTTGRVFDRRSFLKRLGNDEALCREILEVYVSDAPAQVAALEKAVDAGCWPEVAHRAHAIKGAASNVSGHQVEATARELEFAATRGIADEARTLATELRWRIGELTTALRLEV